VIPLLADKIKIDPIQGTNIYSGLIKIAAQYMENDNKLDMTQANPVLDTISGNRLPGC
jgi:hypothetical protein